MVAVVANNAVVPFPLWLTQTVPTVSTDRTLLSSAPLLSGVLSSLLFPVSCNLHRTKSEASWSRKSQRCGFSSHKEG